MEKYGRQKESDKIRKKRMKEQEINVLRAK
jgi:hypothetical protein